MSLQVVHQIAPSDKRAAVNHPVGEARFACNPYAVLMTAAKKSTGFYMC
jgi:hypothetical protein